VYAVAFGVDDDDAKQQHQQQTQQQSRCHFLSTDPNFPNFDKTKFRFCSFLLIVGLRAGGEPRPCGPGGAFVRIRGWVGNIQCLFLVSI
jgi:hypothetical protein